MKTRKPMYCEKCRKIFDSRCPPTIKEWEDFKSCKCLGSTYRSEKAKKRLPTKKRNFN